MLPLRDLLIQKKCLEDNIAMIEAKQDTTSEMVQMTLHAKRESLRRCESEIAKLQE
jgi:hypothetical protein